MSTVLGLPVTTYAAAFYAVAFVIAVRLAGRRPVLDGDDQRALFVLGITDVAVSVGMGLYAKLALDTVCLYCMVLYLISALFFLCAVWLCGCGSVAAMSGALRLGWIGARHRTAALQLAALFLAVVFPHAAVYWRARRGVGRFADCPVSIADLPKTDLVVGSGSPKWILATFLDPTCGFCLVQHEKLRSMLDDRELAGRFALWMYLYPRAPHEPCAPPDFEVAHKAAIDNLACAGAMAIECAERLKPGSGVAALGRAFALQRGRSPFFSVGHLKDLAVEQGIDPRQMVECLNGDADVQRRVVAHVRFGAGQGIELTPRLYAIPVLHGVPNLERSYRFDGDKDQSVLEGVVRSDPESIR
jgi:hypothetical protein